MNCVTEAEASSSRGNQSSGTIAFCGTRGLPANYGGFETAVDEISRRFVDAGYACEVFTRDGHTDNADRESHQGRRLVYVKGSRHRSLDTFVSSIQTGIYLLRHRKAYTHAFWFNNANLPGILITWLCRIPMTVNTDGLEWRRAKWSWPFKLYYFFSSFIVSLVCRSLVSDSTALREYYKCHFRRDTNFIPYGAPTPIAVPSTKQKRILDSLGLTSGRYFLQITRLEPDNFPLEVAIGFADSQLSLDGYLMVSVGYKEDTPYARQLLAFNGRYGVRVLNATYDQEILYTLRANCHCYVHGNSVGGTNPALLEAMACCPRVMALESEFSREVLGETGIYFDSSQIADGIHRALYMPSSDSMSNRVKSLYQWDAVAASYMRLCEKRDADYRPLAYEPPAECAHRRNFTFGRSEKNRPVKVRQRETVEV